MMSATQKAQVDQQVQAYNKTINGGKPPTQQLGKNDFLKLMITQLQYQDPTKPMDDTQSIAQMAQFSSLEQMTNMAEGFSKLSSTMASGDAVSTLGKNVALTVGSANITGQVTAVTRAVADGDQPQVQVNNAWYPWADVQKVYEPAAIPGSTVNLED
jgi:flagellar basal-body rod modification protein FlgD